MSELRQQMIDAMRQRGYSVRTHQAYLGAVRDLARYYRRSPDRLGVEAIGNSFRHLAIERGLSWSALPSTCTRCAFSTSRCWDGRTSTARGPRPRPSPA